MFINRHDRRLASALERKEGGGASPPSLGEIKGLVEGINGAFAEYKATNDRRLAEVEKKGGADPVTTAALAKIEETITTLSAEVVEVGKKANRLQGDGVAGGQTAEQREHRDAFNTWARRGIGDEGTLNAMWGKALGVKSMSTLVPADGGLLVPTIVDAALIDLLRDENPMRQFANVMTVSTPNYSRLVALHGIGTGWVGETDARPATATPQFATVAAYMGEVYANPQVTQTLLDDSVIDLESYLTAELAQEFALAEGAAFLSGDGVKKPKGIMDYPTATTKDATRAYGTFQHIVSGAAGGFAAVNPSDVLVSLIYAMKPGYRTNARWYLNSTVLATVRTWKDGQGNYLWQPGAIAGQPGALLGFPIADLEQMPDVAANAFPVMFGDLRRAYTIIDRIGTRTLRDPYTAKPYVSFYSTRRVGGMSIDTNAVKFIKISV